MKIKSESYNSLVKRYLANNEVITFLRFCITGGVNTAVDFITFSLMIYFGFNYTICQTAGYSAGTLNSYILNKFWTFNSSKVDKKTSKEFTQFIVVNLVSFSATLLGLKILNATLGINIYVAKVIVIVIGQAINFLGYRLWVFRKEAIKNEIG